METGRKKRTKKKRLPPLKINLPFDKAVELLIADKPKKKEKAAR